MEEVDIVVSDDDADPKVASMLRAMNDPRIRYFPHQQSGIAQNWTNAVSRAVAPYAMKLDDDDYIRPGFLSKSCEFLDRHPEASIVFCAFMIERLSGTIIEYVDQCFFRGRSVVNGIEYARALLLNEGYPGNHKSTGVFRWKCARQIGFFDSITMDALWTVAMASLGDVGYIPEILFTYCETAGVTEGMGWRTLKMTMESTPRLFALDSFRSRPEWAAMESLALQRTRVTIPLLFWFGSRGGGWRRKWRMARQLAQDFPDVTRNPMYWPGVIVSSFIPRRMLEALFDTYQNSQWPRRLVNTLSLLGSKRREKQ
jgi:hypothetical protein